MAEPLGYAVEHRAAVDRGGEAAEHGDPERYAEVLHGLRHCRCRAGLVDGSRADNEVGPQRGDRAEPEIGQREAGDDDRSVRRAAIQMRQHQIADN